MITTFQRPQEENVSSQLMDTMNGKITVIKKPYFIQLGDGELIYLAGIWRKELQNDKKQVFSIITRHANSKIKHIHNRMPIILNLNEALVYG